MPTKIRFRIEPAPRFLRILGAKDQIVVQVYEAPYTNEIKDYSIDNWRDATPDDMVHVHEGSVE